MVPKVIDPAADKIGLSEFLRAFPSMMLRPSPQHHVVLRGQFEFTAQASGMDVVSDSFEIEIVVPPDFPESVPVIKELGERIPRRDDNHLNCAGELCLGSPLRLLVMLSEEPTLTGFAEKCIIPYLFATSRRLATGGEFAFGELEHGPDGLLQDYALLFGVDSPVKAMGVLRILALKKRVGNKRHCPCGCGRRVTKCKLHKKLVAMRTLACPSRFMSEALYCSSTPTGLGGGISEVYFRHNELQTLDPRRIAKIMAFCIDSG